MMIELILGIEFKAYMPKDNLLDVSQSNGAFEIDLRQRGIST